MSRNKNAKSPTAALRERVTSTYSEMRGTPEGADGPGNPWELMMKADDKPLHARRLPRFDWTYLIVLLVVAAAVIGLAIWLR